jgi:Fe-S-cluster containining protein
LIALADFRQSPPLGVHAQFLRRIDVAITKATDVSSAKLACKAGCSHCCHLKIQVLAIEAIAIAQYVGATFSAERIREAMGNASKNVKDAKGLTNEQQLTINQRCAFLHDGNCSIYSVRPSECRKYHSTDVQVCIDTYEQPFNMEIQAAYSPEVWAAGEGTKLGYEVALEQSGCDRLEYDTSSAFLEAMRTPKALKRFKAGKRTFPLAKVVHDE